MERQVCSDCNLLMQLGYESLGLAGSREVIWCPKCGHHSYGELYPEMLMEVEEKNYGLNIAWAGEQPNVKEISMIRMLDPNLQEKPLEEVVRLLRRSQNWQITNLSRYDANKILEELRRQNVTVEWSHLEDA
jgi:hypothetical protein